MTVLKITEASLKRLGATAANFEEKLNATLDTHATTMANIETEFAQFRAACETRFGTIETTIRNMESRIESIEKATLEPPIDLAALHDRMAVIAAEASAKAITSIIAKSGTAVVTVSTAPADEQRSAATPAEAFEAAVAAHRTAGMKPADALRKATAEQPANYAAWLEAVKSRTITAKVRF